MKRKSLLKTQSSKKIKDVVVHHIHVRYCDEIFTLFHRGECIDMFDLLRQISLIQVSEENRAKTGVIS